MIVGRVPHACSPRREKNGFQRVNDKRRTAKVPLGTTNGLSAGAGLRKQPIDRRQRGLADLVAFAQQFVPDTATESF